MKLHKRMMKALGFRFSGQPTFLSYLPRVGSEMRSAVGDGHDHSVVMAPLQWMMRTFPEAPLVVDRREDDTWQVDQEHAMSELIRRPNPFWSGELLWMATLLSLVADGNGYWLKARDEQMRVTQLWWAPTWTIEPWWPADGRQYISHYIYSPGTDKQIKLPVEEVVHFRWGVDPQNSRKGLSPLASVIREVYTDQEGSIFTASLLKNMGVPGLIVSPDGDAVLSDEDMEASSLELKERFTGSRRGEPLVAGAPTKVSQFGFSPQQLDLRSLRRLPEERVTAVLGVPAIVAGLGAGLDRSTFANMAEAREMAYESGIIPTQRMLASDIYNQLLPDFEAPGPNIRTRFDLKQVRVLQEDENKLVARKLDELRAGAITRAEYLKETGRIPRDTDEVFLLPFNVMEVPPGGLPEPEPSSIRPGRPPGETLNPPDAEEVETSARGFKATRTQQDLIKRFRKDEADAAGQFTSQLVEMFMDLGDEAASAYLSLAKANHPDDVAMVRRILEMVEADRWNRSKLRPMMERHYERVMKDTVGAINEVTGIEVSLPDARARRIISEGGKRAALVDIKSGTRTSLFASLAKSRELGEGPKAAARRIRDTVPAGRFVNAGPQYRAQLIARTETKWAQNQAAMQTYREAEAVSGVLAFDAQGGGASDDECVSRDGMTFSFDEADSELSNEHPNGTLSFAPVI